MASGSTRAPASQGEPSQASPASRFQSLSPAKQFALITLAALGTSMFLTGRTVRSIMRRIPPTESSTSSKVVVPPSHPGIQLEKETIKLRELKVEGHPIFWDNQSLRCIRERRSLHDDFPEELLGQKTFNPALDALKALGISTVLVIGSSFGLINFLSYRFELDGWYDWKMWLQSESLKKMIFLSHGPRSNGQAEEDLSEQSGFDQDLLTSWSKKTGWIQRLEDEWAQEKMRRKDELACWERQRRSEGKRIWN